MAYNPCGRAVDFGRRPYSTKARFHNDPSAPLVDLKWYVTDLPFLEVESSINSRDWDDTPYLEYEVGEVPTWSDPRAYNGAWTQPLGVFGAHVCHPEWFFTGQPWPVTTPTTNYNPERVPTCCCVPVYHWWGAEPVVVSPPSDTFACNRWLGIGPISGKGWQLTVQGLDPVALPWRVFRVRNGLPTFYQWNCVAPWNGRGVSPPFVTIDPLDPTYPVQQLFVIEGP